MAQDHGYLASFQIKEILSKGENLPSLTRGQIYLAYFSREICPLEDAELREPGLCFDTTVRYKKSTITTRDWTVIRLAKRMKK